MPEIFPQRDYLVPHKKFSSLLTVVRLIKHLYEVRPRKDHRGVDLISDVLPFGRLWYVEIPDAIEYAEHYSRAHDAVINVYDASGKLRQVHRHKGDFKEP